MRTTLNINDKPLEEAQRLSGLSEIVALVREGFRALIERESARRLANSAAASLSCPPSRGIKAIPNDSRRYLGLDRASTPGRRQSGGAAQQQPG